MDAVSTKSRKKGSSLFSIFMHADTTDMILMTLGFLGSLGDGFGIPLLMLLTSKIMNTVGGGSTSDPHTLSHNINKNVINIIYFATGSLVACFLGLVYGRILMLLVGKTRHEYDKAGNIVEQAISSIRTVYSFVGESKTMNEFSVVLQRCLKYGLKQGLVKGVAIGGYGITFAIWALPAWYGSRLVMYHDGKEGTVFAVGTLMNIGGM
ncbi:hypothetical protein GIB67_009596 [Kingdonia uniflora]|uniref:ABC transmembrane type-1 domain-containing protein n=1 Tax=Kingdonia uniflora TaxID=39325 RepID=A0A7J7M3Y7_9MAGN|nr:hypothetical protein GIB67_009596 [Kingdonia uniflora]